MSYTHDRLNVIRDGTQPAIILNEVDRSLDVPETAPC